MANIVKKYTRFVAGGCFHSVLSCPTAADHFMSFVHRYKPQVRIDLGDVHDFAAFRSGAKGGKDEVADVGLDFNAGVEWLNRFRPTHRTKGNHDDRIDQLASHPNAIVAHCAGKVLEDLRRVDEKNKTIVRPYCMDDGWFTFGDTKFGHGWMFNEMAVRDHAEAFGKCVIAHLHSPGEMRGRRGDRPTGWCVGSFIDPKKATYAKNWRGRLRWAHGFVWGEFSDKYCSVHLERWNCKHGEEEEWHSPL